MVDGSLKFDTKFDTSGVNKATDMVNKSVSRMYQRVKQAFSGKEVDQSSAKMKQLQTNVDEANAKVEKQISDIERLRAEYAELKADDGYIEPEAAVPLIEQAETLKAKIAEAKQQVAEYDKQWEQGVAGADSKSSQWIDKLHSLQEEYDKILEKIEKIESKAEAKHQTDRDAQLKAYEDKIADSEGKLEGLKNKAEIAKMKLNEALDSKVPSDFKKGLSGATGGLNKFTRRVIGLAKRVFIFSVITKALRKLRDLLSKMTSTDTQIQNSLANIKGNLLTAFQPIYEVALPALKKLLLVLEQVTAFVAQFTAAMFGKSVAQMQKNAKVLNKQATATSKVGKAAEKASRSLASFDELNQLSSNSDSSSGGGSSAGASVPSFDSDIGEMDAKIEIILSHALVLAGVALIMIGIATMNIKAALTGVGFVIMGLAFGKGSGAFDKTPPWIKQVVTWAQLILGAVLLIVGIALLAAAGSGIPFILAGISMLATGIAYGKVSGAFAETPQWLKTILTWGAVSLSTALLVMGLAMGNPILIGLGIAAFKKSIDLGRKNGTFDYTLNMIKTFGNAASNFIVGAWNRVKNKASEVFRSISSGATRMWDTVKNAGRDRLNGIISLVERCINTVVNKANRISWNIPEWVPGIGGKRFGFNLPTVSIPRLATGTVVPRNYGEYTAILGDNKREPEVVSPLSTMKQAVKEVLSELGDNTRPISITVYTVLDGMVVGKSVVEYHNGVVRRTGKTPLVGVKL